MKTFLISYDLGVPETSEDYKRVINYIKKYFWAKPLYSVWLIRTEKSVSQIRDDLKNLVDSNDSILVIDVSGSNWATYNIPNDVTEWMKQNL